MSTTNKFQTQIFISLTDCNVDGEWLTENSMSLYSLVIMFHSLLSCSCHISAYWDAILPLPCSGHRHLLQHAMHFTDPWRLSPQDIIRFIELTARFVGRSWVQTADSRADTAAIAVSKARKPANLVQTTKSLVVKQCPVSLEGLNVK